MNLQDKVAIVIVTYNGEKWLDKCIKPLYDKENVKIIVVDNGSKDFTNQTIINKYPEVELIISKENLGFGQANNKGFEYAIKNNFDYVFLLNQDASIDINNLTMLVNLYKKDNRIGILSPVHFKTQNEIENIFKFYLKDNKLNVEEVEKLLIEKVKFVNAALWLISVENLKKIGGFNPLFFHYGEDVEFVNRTVYNKLDVFIAFKIKGFHYREYSKESFKQVFKKKRVHFGPWPVKYFIILTNINDSFFKNIILSIILFLKSIIKHSLEFNFFSIYYDLKVYSSVLLSVNKIYKNRKYIKKGEKFLKN